MMSAAVFIVCLHQPRAFPATSRGEAPAKTWRTSRAGNGVIVQSNGNRNCCAVSVGSRVVRQEPEGRQVASEGDHTSHMHWTDRTGSSRHGHTETARRPTGRGDRPGREPS